MTAQWIEFARFAWRNPAYVTRAARRAWSTHKAMQRYRAAHPRCAWCGRSEHLDVHHIEPVSVAPQLAADERNMIMLCRKPPCHQVIGHDGDYARRYVANVRELTRLRSTVGIRSPQHEDKPGA